MLFLATLVKFLLFAVPLLISVAYFTLAERKILAGIQRRRGPNVIGAFGLLQPLSDGLKLLLKELIIPSSAAAILFIFSPLLTFFISLLGWFVIPFSKFALLVNFNLGVLYALGVSSLGVYGIILSGWSSNSKYAFLGALRSTAQMISYEVSMGFILISILILTNSLDFEHIIAAQENVWFIFPLFPLFLVFFISSLAETNRHPFDLPEAEAELVSGYNVEYSSMAFALFSLGEYSNMLFISALNVILFLGGWQGPGLLGPIFFALKMCIFVILFIWARAALPRYRYDQLMTLGWQVFLPVSMSFVILSLVLVFGFNLGL
jgi:NADH-quinone oxidoreductase subunit H